MYRAVTDFAVRPLGWGRTVGDSGVSGRNGSVDVLRFVGAAGLVWFHVGAPGGAITLAALPMFVALTVYYGVRESESVPISEFALRRAQRLLVPWLGWSLIYALAKVADAVVSGRHLSSEFDTYMFLTGPQLHLWFLPFAFAAVIVSRFTLTSFRERRPRGAWLIAMYVAIATISLLSFERFEPAPPIAQWLTVLPAVFLGMILVGADSERGVLWLAPIVGAVVFPALIMLGVAHGALSNMLASFLVFGCFAFALPASQTTVALSQLALGIYLVHPLVIALLERLTSIPSGAPEAITVIAISTIVTVALQRAPLLHRIV